MSDCDFNKFFFSKLVIINYGFNDVYVFKCGIDSIVLVFKLF